MLYVMSIQFLCSLISSITLCTQKNLIQASNTIHKQKTKQHITTKKKSDI